MLLVHLVSLCMSLTCGCFPGLRSVPSSFQGEAQIGLKGLTAMILKPPASGLSFPAHEQSTPSECLLASLITWGNALCVSMLIRGAYRPGCEQLHTVSVFPAASFPLSCASASTCSHRRESQEGPLLQVQSSQTAAEDGAAACHEVLSPPCPRSYTHSLLSVCLRQGECFCPQTSRLTLGGSLTSPGFSCPICKMAARQ